MAKRWNVSTIFRKSNRARFVLLLAAISATLFVLLHSSKNSLLRGGSVEQFKVTSDLPKQRQLFSPVLSDTKGLTSRTSRTDVSLYEPFRQLQTLATDATGKCSLKAFTTEATCTQNSGTWTKGTWVFNEEGVDPCAEPSPSLMTYIINFAISVILICFSGLFSGLTLGLLGLDLNGLDIIIKGDPDSEDGKNAKIIYPLRKNGNHLLCTLLLGNVMVNAMLSILLAEITGGFMGFVSSTVFIVIFGEIIPQATCARYALKIGAKAVPIVRVIMCLMYPLAKPTSNCLDRFLGEELGTVYTRSQLKEVMKYHSTQNVIGGEEVDVLAGALSYQEKKVHEVMTPLVDVFMVPDTLRLNFQAISDVFKNGYSRIPVFAENAPEDFRGLLFTKDLILIDPEDEIPVKNLIQFFSRPLLRVYEDDTLGKVLGLFKTSQSHLALVLSAQHPEDGKDSYYITTGIITLEDIIEEILQDEIVDETDMYKTLGADKKKNNARKLFDIAQLRVLDSASNDSSADGGNGLTDTEIKVIATHLINNVEQFRDAQSIMNRSETKTSENLIFPDKKEVQVTLESVEELVKISKVLRFPALDDSSPAKLARRRNSVIQKTPGADEAAAAARRLYVRGRCDNHCTLILDGKVSISAGSEGFRSKMGKFDILAKPALIAQPNAYVPDYTATAVGTESTCVLRISSMDYKHIILGKPVTPMARREKSRDQNKKGRDRSKSREDGGGENGPSRHSVSEMIMQETTKLLPTPTKTSKS